MATKTKRRKPRTINFKGSLAKTNKRWTLTVTKGSRLTARDLVAVLANVADRLVA